MEKMFEQAQELQEELREIRREIHMHPEISFAVEKTQQLVLRYLSDCNLDSISAIGKHFKRGVRAVLHGTAGIGKTILLRADMDALPQTEITETPYKSQVEGAMHACGHDAHTAMLLGAAKVLGQNKDKLHGTIIFLFEPAEEISDRVGDRLITGAEDLCEDGALEGVDECYALHVNPTIETGYVGINQGNAMASVAAFEVDLLGIAGHGGMPHKAVDPIAMAAEFVTSIYTMMAREINPLDPAVFTFGTIHGGDALNSVGSKVTVTGTFRTYQHAVTERIWQGLYRRAKGIALSYGGNYEVRERFHDGWAVVNKPAYVEIVQAAATHAVDAAHVLMLEEAGMSGETFGYYLDQLPGAFVWLGAGNEAKGIHYGIHDARFDIDEDALVCGVKLHIAIALQALAPTI